MVIFSVFLFIFDHSAPPLWLRILKNPDIGKRPLARPFAYIFALLTHSLALHRSLPLHVLIPLLTRSPTLQLVRMIFLSIL